MGHWLVAAWWLCPHVEAPILPLSCRRLIAQAAQAWLQSNPQVADVVSWAACKAAVAGGPTVGRTTAPLHLLPSAPAPRSCGARP